MPTTYSVPDADDLAVALLATVLKDSHPSLVDADTRIGITFAANERGPAVRSGGHACLATVRVVPLRDRVRKDCDAEITIDEARWRDMSQAQQAALLDHEASHLKLVRDRKTDEVRRDDLGRPRLRLVKADLQPGDMFRSVIERHGPDAPEFESAARAHSFAQAALSGN